MPRLRRRQFDKVADYVSEQVSLLSRKYRRFRFVFLATFVLIGAANLAVAGLALAAMIETIRDGTFDDAAIVALVAAATSLINLVLVAVNAVLRYSYKKTAYANASKTIQNAYVAYVYGMGRYEAEGLETFQQDVKNIVDDVFSKRGHLLQTLLRQTVDMGD